jgi:signal transduction histidine kinase
MLTLHHREKDYYSPRQVELALAFANQAAVAIENARLYKQSQQLAALEERQRLARELHDSVSQALYGIALGARTARTLLDRDPSKLAEPLDYVLSLADAGLAEMRALIFELRPESLEMEGLVAALTKQADSLRARHHLEINVVCGEEPPAPLAVKEALYRIAQEALHNIVKHAHARRVEVRLEWADEGVQLEIKDDGLGFDTDSDFPGHLGLRSMRERAERLGGLFSVESESDQGACVHVEIPC